MSLRDMGVGKQVMCECEGSRYDVEELEMQMQKDPCDVSLGA